MNNNLFSNKRNFKKLGISILAIFLIVTAIYNVKFQSVTKYKAQQQSMADEYNLNGENRNGSVTINSEINGTEIEDTNKDATIPDLDASIIESSESASSNNSKGQNTGNDNEINHNTLSDNTDDNHGISVTQGSSNTGGEINTSSSEMQDVTCYIEIRCDAISINMSKWTNSNKDKSIVPANGVIVEKIKINVINKGTVLDVLKKALLINNLSMEESLGYIKSINQLGQMDAGRGSGWLYWVNNVSPSVACSSYAVKNGDNIKWQYTCNYGDEFDKNGDLK